MAQRRVQTSENDERRRKGSMMRRLVPPQPGAQDEPSPQQADGRVKAEDVRTRIERLAYELFQQRGRLDGYHEQDWLEAERLTLTDLERAGQEGSGLRPITALA